MPLSPIQYPMVNGVRTDHSSIEVRFNGTPTAIKAINWSEALDPGELFGNDAVALGYTRGQYKPTLDFELFKPEADSFEVDLFTYAQSVGAGIQEVFFLVTIYHKQESSSVGFTQIQTQARITKISTGSTAGNEHHSKKYDCVCTPIVTDGRVSTTGPINF